MAFGGGWQDDIEPPVIVHRRPRGGFPPFPLFPGGPRDPLGGMLNPSPFNFGQRVDALVDYIDAMSENIGLSMRPLRLPLPPTRNRTDPNTAPDYRSSYRSHRPGAAAPRSGDDGINPLLQRHGASGPGRDGSSRPTTMGSWIQAMGGPGAEILDIGFSGRPFGEGPGTAALLDEVIRSLPPMPGNARNGQALQFHITTGPGHQLPPDIQAMFGMRPSHFPRRADGEPGSAAFFTPTSTTARWLEESKILFGTSTLEAASTLASAILSLLVPPAIEADKAIKAAEAERVRKLEEEAKKRAEEERIAKEAKEAEEKAAREKKEAEEREAAERAAAEALAARGPEPEQDETENAEPAESTAEAMEGVETEGTPAAGEQAQEAPAADRPRVMTMIRGSPFDITDLGIDADFLQELPEDIREEVIMSTVAERRSQAAATGAPPSEIDQEFLDALPDDIREEIIQQERQERRRREREERNRAATAANGGAGAPDMDAASIIASLAPGLREQVLMEQDEEVLALLPRELAEHARAAMRDHPVHGRIPGGFARRGPPPGPNDAREVNSTRPPRRAIVQMLDKSGVATLLRLMFILQHGSLRSTLNSVLQNIILNRHNRIEVLSTLLHILQDGSVDMSAVERSFAHLSLRAKQPKDAQPKTPQPLKKALTGLGPATQTTFEASPLMVVQQCLTALVYLNQVNPHSNT